MAADRLSELFERYLARTANPAEKEALAALALEAENEEKLKELISQSWELTGVEEDMPEAVAEQVLSRILHYEDTQVPARHEVASGRPAGRRIFLRRWERAGVAATIFLIAGIALWMLAVRPSGSHRHQNAQLSDLAAPSAVKAMITLADGKQIALDSAAKGLLAMQGDVEVVREANGDIRYADSQPAGGEVTYNTLFNPRGSKVAVITLADGTRVWLNSESSLRFYSAVGKDARRVELSGEAYFEVAKDPGHGFIVSADGVSTEVLGTHFNVNRYSDESTARITLLEGAIKVKQGIATAVLKPGQQANVTSKIEVLPQVDTDAAVAWKNGLFNFQDQPLSTVLKQVARWYDINIIYEKQVPDIMFFGEIESNVSLAQMLHFLERSGVRFTMDSQKKQLIIH
ncbi:FecR family protein [Chitinophaga ginsengisegetis]|uniref:FecR family protein n=1 Tax=Chitinophaga ginsengisegetis TaxID=393003 RepID=A0A1T5N5D7_9BACT|nr:FecR family protein [Chitinophaga ginsengisegetis]SKC95690.1 FecR family protein [Chitinophaga ginsengisegetis]